MEQRHPQGARMFQEKCETWQKPGCATRRKAYEMPWLNNSKRNHWLCGVLQHASWQNLCEVRKPIKWTNKQSVLQTGDGLDLSWGEMMSPTAGSPCNLRFCARSCSSNKWYCWDCTNKEGSKNTSLVYLFPEAVQGNHITMAMARHLTTGSSAKTQLNIFSSARAHTPMSIKHQSILARVASQQTHQGSWHPK